MTNEALKVLEQRAYQLREDISDRQSGQQSRRVAVAKSKKALEQAEAELQSWDRETHRLIRTRTEVDKAIDVLKKVDDDPNELEIE